jgi:hypothetical protein
MSVNLRCRKTTVEKDAKFISAPGISSSPKHQNDYKKCTGQALQMQEIRLSLSEACTTKMAENQPSK